MLNDMHKLHLLPWRAVALAVSDAPSALVLLDRRSVRGHAVEVDEAAGATPAAAPRTDQLPPALAVAQADPTAGAPWPEPYPYRKAVGAGLGGGGRLLELALAEASAWLPGLALVAQRASTRGASSGSSSGHDQCCAKLISADQRDPGLVRPLGSAQCRASSSTCTVLRRRTQHRPV